MAGPIRKPHLHVTAALIWKNGKVLIARRPKGSHLAGLWEFPGGKQEHGESLEACLEREILEELGVRVATNRFLMTVDYEYPSKVVYLHAFCCKTVEGEPRPLESSEIRWVDPVRLKGLSFPPPDQKVIEFLEQRNGRDPKGAMDVYEKE